ncbi:MAG: hypothetical protein M3Y58_13770, partial [Chloroflexota bacterium]|nr:hypothetical protein [Chloroflexota bacterium]
MSAREGDSAQPRDAERSGLPPGIREESPPAMPQYAEEAGTAAADMNRPPQPWEGDAYPPGYGTPARPDSPQSAQRYDRFGWPIPAGVEANQGDQRPIPPPAQDANPREASSSWRIPPDVGSPPRGPYSGQFPAQEPAPNQPPLPRGPYSGQFPTQPPRQSGAFPVTPTPPERVSRSGALPIPPDNRRSGPFPVPPADPVYQSGAYAVPPEAGMSGYAVTASGPIPQSPYISGPLPRVGEQPGAVRRSGPLPYPSEVTSTGSRRVIVAPDAGVGSLLADR